MASADATGPTHPDPGIVPVLGSNIDPGSLVNNRSPEFDARMRAYLGNRYAYVWTTNETVFNVGVVNPTRADADQAEAYAAIYGAKSVIVPMVRSANQLESYRVQVDQILRTTPSGVFSGYWIDPARNQIEIVLRTNDQETINRLNQQVPEGVLAISVQPGGMFRP
jgi:hypothetical protein